MKDKEVLQKAIEMAVENGMENNNYSGWMLSVLKEWLGDIENGIIGSYENEFHINEIVFSHDFAKAFWGEEKTYTIPHSNITNPIWKLCLSEMVLEENPVDYLRKYIL